MNKSNPSLHNEMQSMRLLNEKVDSFIPEIVCKLNINLGIPHTPVFTQGEAVNDNTALYYIGKGTSKVCLRDARGKETKISEL